MIRVLQRGGNPSPLGRAASEVGRIAKTLYLFAYIDDEAYRRRVLTQLNRQEGRHSLARAIFHGRRGQVRKKYREGVVPRRKSSGFEVLPRRWVVERTFAWLGTCRRLAKDYERRA